MKHRLTTIIKLGLPIMLAMLSQSMINLADAALVGPLGEAALAAVGAGSYANFVALSLLAGLSAGIQAQVARRDGAGRTAECIVPINHGLLLSVLFALPVSLLLASAAPWLLNLIYHSNTASFTSDATAYFQIRVLSLPAAAMILSFRGFWNGAGQPRSFLYLLVITHISNVAISYLLIYGNFGLPALGVKGAALGTLISMYLCALLNFIKVKQQTKASGLLSQWGNLSSFKRLVQLIIPDSLQQTLFALGMMLLFAMVAKMGTSAMAVAHVLMNISLVLILPGLGLGMAANTLVSKSLGAHEPERAWQWGQETMYTASASLLLLSLPLLLMPETVLALFLHNPALVQLGKIPLQLTGIGLILDAPSLVFIQALLGAGANRVVLYIRFLLQWLLLLPVCWLIGPELGLGLTAFWAVTTIQRLISSISFMAVWNARKWSRISI
ncbi:MATE family efflux transporter [uncultured Endozoicomonas sp.]|uniref:MATE family efflux transporter n=1 Tax=uncultured Endozoicomonas sp. TaxID=432652 RepID=UPI0026160CED|nr:MATE family efflux transporter [uncultured Endozoicomonas sp.]